MAEEKVAEIVQAIEQLTVLELAELVKALEEKFGVVPEGFQTKLQEIQDREVLRGLLRQTIRASSIEEFKKSLQS